MWDNPRLLNAAAGFLTALALIVFGIAAVQLLWRSTLFPLRELAVGIVIAGLYQLVRRVRSAQPGLGRPAGKRLAHRPARPR